MENIGIAYFTNAAMENEPFGKEVEGIMTSVARLVAIKRIGSSTRSIPSLIGMAETSVVRPSTNAMFAILDPMAFPTARLLESCSAAIADTISSGAEVPKATTVKPTSIGVIPRCNAVETAPSTKWSALQIKITSPTIRAKLNTNK